MGVSRRTIMGWGLGTAAVGLAGCGRATQAVTGTTPAGALASSLLCEVTPSASCVSAAAGGQWSQPATWGAGGVPGPGDSVAITGPVVLDVDASVESLTIEASGSLSFEPSASRTLESQRNVVVLGGLHMQPSLPSVRHLLRFTGAVESDYVGGGMVVLESDVGLWVMGAGVVDLQGAEKLAWTRAAGSIAAGAQSIALVDAPNGWQAGDELVVTPTRPPTPEDDPSHTSQLVKIAAIDGRTVTLTQPLGQAHPAVDVGRGTTLTAEVLNLTRNVGIEGLPEKRAHVLLHAPAATSPQKIRYVALRHLGPRQQGGEGGDEPDEVTGRYALHFHHCQEGSRGSIVEGAVGRDLGSHTFVPHESSGTTWRDCIAHDVHGAAYWWDPNDRTVDVLFERCVASDVAYNASEELQNAGFLLGKGPKRRMTVRDCVASNVIGDGFLWYDGDATWVFEDSVAHNCEGSGVRVWQNNSLPHLLERTICYHNDGYGIDHGAYGNAFQYVGGSMVGNNSASILVRAVSSNSEEGDPLTFADLFCDAGGREFAIGIADGSPVDPARATIVHGCTFLGYTKAAVYFLADGKDADVHVTDCTFCGNELWLESGMGAGSRIVLSDAVHGEAVVAPLGQPGTEVPDWNAVARGLQGRSDSECDPAELAGGAGYFLFEADGDIYAFGGARGSLRSWDPAAIDDESRSVTTSKVLSSRLGGATVVGAASSDRGGLWVLLSSGTILDIGPATPAPGVAAAALTKRVAGRPEAPAALARVGNGDLWVFTTAGRVVPQFGKVPSTVSPEMEVVLGKDLWGPVISAQPTVDGSGVYAAADDGGVFTYNAPFLGSVYDAIAQARRVPVGSVRPDQPVVGITPDPDGSGYWLVGADGGVFTFDTPFRGSLPAVVPFSELVAPVSEMVPFGNGYLLLASDGGVFNFSNRPFAGSASGLANTPITAIATVP